MEQRLETVGNGTMKKQNIEYWGEKGEGHFNREVDCSTYQQYSLINY